MFLVVKAGLCHGGPVDHQRGHLSDKARTLWTAFRGTHQTGNDQLQGEPKAAPVPVLSPQTGSTELSQLSSFALPFILYSLDYLVKFISFSEQETEFHFKCNLRRKVCCC